jgi:TM2 domain-containing membrane protein YozV
MSTMVGPPMPPWGTWTWGDGTPIDVALLPPYDSNKKLTAGLLGILLGGFGVHKFVLGYTNEGIIQIVITVFTCGIGSLLGLVEGILYLTKSDSEFYWTYVAGRKGWF